SLQGDLERRIRLCAARPGVAARQVTHFTKLPQITFLGSPADKESCRQKASAPAFWQSHLASENASAQGRQGLCHSLLHGQVGETNRIDGQEQEGRPFAEKLAAKDQQFRQVLLEAPDLALGAPPILGGIEDDALVTPPTPDL